MATVSHTFLVWLKEFDCLIVVIDFVQSNYYSVEFDRWRLAKVEEYAEMVSIDKFIPDHQVANYTSSVDWYACTDLYITSRVNY